MAQDNNGKTNYFAMIGDIVGSREIENRAQFQRKLTKLIEHLNRNLKIVNFSTSPIPFSQVASPIQLSQGDEVQVLFRSASAILPVILELSDGLYPQKLLFGLGRGPLTTDLLKDTVAMDGPCFHHARNALEASYKDSWVVAEGFGNPFDEVITAQFRFLGLLRDGWTERQWQIVTACRNKPQNQVAEELNVAKSVISESLKAAHSTPVLKGEDALGKFLRLFDEKGKLTLCLPKKAN